MFGFRIGFTCDEEASGRFGDDAASGNLLRAWDFSLPEDRETPLFRGYARRQVNAWVPRFDAKDLEDGSRSRYEGCGLDESERPEIGALKTFNTLACEARERRRPGAGADDPEGWIGVSALMTLKGDVDNLGAIFQRGLEAPSLSRIGRDVAAGERVLRGAHLPYLCRTEFRNTYTVFAGGDDFFLIGPWTDQMALAARLRADFHRYVSENARISFSAGLAMTKPGLPVRRLEAMAEHSLDKAKGFGERPATPRTP